MWLSERTAASKVGESVGVEPVSASRRLPVAPCDLVEDAPEALWMSRNGAQPRAQRPRSEDADPVDQHLGGVCAPTWLTPAGAADGEVEHREQGVTGVVVWPVVE